MATRYYIAIPDPDKARAAGEFAFSSQGADSMARELQDALHTPPLFERWRATPADPDEVAPALGAPDPAATVEDRQDDPYSDLTVVPSRYGAGLTQRRARFSRTASALRAVPPATPSHSPTT